MAFAETNNLKGRAAKGNFLGDMLSVVGHMALSALGSVASGALGSLGGEAMGSILGKPNEAVQANGGSIPQMMQYQGGGTHEQNPMGGIPVDHLGNPSSNSSALVEANEVGYKLPGDKTGYVFSDRIKIPGSKNTFASEAKKIASKYKNRLGKDLNKPDSLAKDAMDMEMSQLKDSQEQIKQAEQMQQMQEYAYALGGYLKSMLPEGGGIPLASAANPAPTMGLPVSKDQVYDPNYASSLRYYPENASATRAAKYPYDADGRDPVRRGNFSQSPTYTANYGEELPVTPYGTGKPVSQGGYSSLNDAVTSVLNNKGLRDVAVDRAFGDSLNKFLDPRGLASIDSLNMANARAGDTTGRHAAVEGIVKRFPNAVDPKKIFKPEHMAVWQAAQGNSELGTANSGFYKSPTDSNLLTSKKDTKGTKETSGVRGENLWGMRNAAATNLNSFKHQGTTHGVTAEGKDVGSGAVFTVPISYDIKDGQFSGKVTNISGDPSKFKANSRSEQYNPEQFFRNYGTKANGGYLQQLAEGGSPSETDNFLKGSGYKESMIGSGIQALTRLPQLFTQPNSVQYDRVSPELVDYAQERGGMETSRNNQLGFLKRQASTAGSAGQALNYLASAVPSAYNQYDQQYAQSIERQQNTNAQLMNQANAQNAQIQMREAEANAMEKDAARGIRDQAISDIGNIGAQAFQTKPKMMQQYNMLKAQAATTDNDIGWNPDGSMWTKLRREAPEATTGAGFNPNVAAQVQSAWNPILSSLNASPLSNTLANNNKLFGKGTIPGLAGMNFSNASPTNVPINPTQKMTLSPEEEAELLGTLSNPQLFMCGGSLKKCKGGYLKKKSKK